MQNTSCENTPQLVLYHAVSSYQLLEVMLHRMVYHPNDKGVLLLPDFITKIYPQYKKLVFRRFFSAVYLFPYLQIPQESEEQVTADVRRFYEQTVPYAIEDFSRVYVAGAHFFFSLYLIERKIPFYFFEDAAGVFSKPAVLDTALRRTFLLHAKIARRHGLFSGENPLVLKIILLKSAQSVPVDDAMFWDFSVEKTLQSLPDAKRRRVIRLFLRRRLHTKADAILLTQQFSNLGIMDENEQKRLYQNLRKDVLHDVSLLIKKHPDDTVDYREIFPNAQILKPVFPAELLPFVFYKRPKRVYTFDSASCENLKGHFIIRKIRREEHAG